MKKVKHMLLSILVLVALFCVIPQFATVNAAAKNSVSTSVSKIASKAKGFKVTWKKKSGVEGYQIQYSTSSKFSKSTTQTKTVEGNSKTSLTVSDLKGCKVTYYVRVRTYIVSEGETIYSGWSSAKKVTTLKHSYAAATCTAAKTCKYCGKTSGKALGHKWSKATCTKAKTCTRCKTTSGKALGHKYTKVSCTKAIKCSRCKKSTVLGHEYAAATCTKPKTCTRCKKTSGKSLGHNYAAATCTKAKTCTRCKKTSGKSLGHQYSAATCTKAKTCTRCKKTSGKSLGHNYAAATCTKAKTCTRCNNTVGKAFGHSWNAATCTEPKKCKICDTTEGSANGHSVQTEYDSNNDSIVSKCQNCTYSKSEAVKPLKLNFVKIHSHYYDYYRFLSFNFTSDGGYGELTYTFILYNNDMTKIISQCSNESGKGNVSPLGSFKDTKLKVIVRDQYGHSDENIYDTQSLDIDWWYMSALSVAKYEAKSSSVTPNWYYHTILENRYNSNIIDYVDRNFTVDWNKQAKIYAQYCLDRQSYTRDELIKKLMVNGFTQEQAVYGVEENGL